MLCFRVVGSFVFAWVIVLRVIAYAFAFVCCMVAFHITSVCKLHVCFVFVCLVCLFVLVCYNLRLIVYAFAFLCCKVAFQITRACR